MFFYKRELHVGQGSFSTLVYPIYNIALNNDKNKNTPFLKPGHSKRKGKVILTTKSTKWGGGVRSIKTNKKKTPHTTTTPGVRLTCLYSPRGTMCAFHFWPNSSLKETGARDKQSLARIMKLKRNNIFSLSPLECSKTRSIKRKSM